MLRLQTSLDGTEFSDVSFPSNVNVQSNGFSVLDSPGDNGGVFVDSCQNDELKQEYGSLFISDKNGLQFTRSLIYTNRNSNGLVDFKRIDGILGLILANQVVHSIVNYRLILPNWVLGYL